MKHIIFDIDGTIFDTKQGIIACLNDVLLSNGDEPIISEEENKILIETLEKQKESYIKIRKSRKYRRPIRKNRRLGYNRRRYSYPTKRNNYTKRRPVYNNNMRFRKSPARGRVAPKKLKEPRMNSQDKKATAAKN